MNENVYWKLSYGMYVISTKDGSHPTGCIANCAMQVTVEPATIAVSINRENYTNECIIKNGQFALSILSEKADPELIRAFGFESGKKIDKFDNVPYFEKDKLPILSESCGYLICKLVDKLETATHTVFLGEIIDGDVLNDLPVMTYAYYHEVIKGRSPKTAPTYIKAKNDADTDKYVCKVCGYIYDGETPFEDLPEDYLCPICKKPKSYFEKIE